MNKTSEHTARTVQARHLQEGLTAQVAHAKEWATPGVVAALHRAVSGMDTGVEAASPRIQAGLRRLADELAGGAERAAPRLHEGLERAARKLPALADSAGPAPDLHPTDRPARKIWLILGLFAGGITLWRALRTPGETPTAKAPSQEQAARAMDAAAAGLRHAADDLKAQVAHLSNELRAQASRVAPGVKPGIRHSAGGGAGGPAAGAERARDDAEEQTMQDGAPGTMDIRSGPGKQRADDAAKTRDADG